MHIISSRGRNTAHSCRKRALKLSVASTVVRTHTKATDQYRPYDSMNGLLLIFHDFDSLLNGNIKIVPKPERMYVCDSS